MKKFKEGINNLNDKDLQSTSGGTFDKISPNIIRINNDPKDLFPKNKIKEILKNYKKDK